MYIFKRYGLVSVYNFSLWHIYHLPRRFGVTLVRQNFKETFFKKAINIKTQENKSYISTFKERVDMIHKLWLLQSSPYWRFDANKSNHVIVSCNATWQFTATWFSTLTFFINRQSKRFLGMESSSNSTWVIDTFAAIWLMSTRGNHERELGKLILSLTEINRYLSPKNKWAKLYELIRQNSR